MKDYEFIHEIINYKFYDDDSVISFMKNNYLNYEPGVLNSNNKNMILFYYLFLLSILNNKFNDDQISHYITKLMNFGVDEVTIKEYDNLLEILVKQLLLYHKENVPLSHLHELIKKTKG